MSLFNTMRTASSGMQAQSNALSTIGDNIANSSTAGYKDATAQFQTAVDGTLTPRVPWVEVSAACSTD